MAFSDADDNEIVENKSSGNVHIHTGKDNVETHDAKLSQRWTTKTSKSEGKRWGNLKHIYSMITDWNTVSANGLKAKAE